MAAIPDAGGARRAPRGVQLRTLLRGVLLRVVMLGALVVVGWLLGSGIAQAHEDPGHENSAEYTDLFGLVMVPALDGGFGGPPSSPPVVEPAARGLMRAVPVTRLTGQPTKHLPAVTPVLARVSQHITEPVVRSATHAPATRAAIGKPATVDKPAPVPVAAVPLAEPAVRAGPAPVPAAVQPTVGDVPSATPVGRALRPVAAQFAGPPARGGGPVAPVPASPPGPVTPACPVGSSGGGTTTSCAHFATSSDSWAMTDLAPGHRLHSSSGTIPWSAAEQPTTSPD